MTGTILPYAVEVPVIKTCCCIHVDVDNVLGSYIDLMDVPFFCPEQLTDQKGHMPTPKFAKYTFFYIDKIFGVKNCIVLV